MSCLELGLCFDKFNVYIFAMHFYLICSIKQNYLSHYLGNIELRTSGEDIIISNELVWVQKRIIPPICFFKRKCSGGDL